MFEEGLGLSNPDMMLKFIPKIISSWNNYQQILSCSPNESVSPAPLSESSRIPRGAIGPPSTAASRLQRRQLRRYRSVWGTTFLHDAILSVPAGRNTPFETLGLVKSAKFQEPERERNVAAEVARPRRSFDFKASFVWKKEAKASAKANRTRQHCLMDFYGAIFRFHLNLMLSSPTRYDRV